MIADHQTALRGTVETSADADAIHASDFGWLPGVLDMAAAQSAIDAAVATGRTLMLDDGTYLLDGSAAMIEVAGTGVESLTIAGTGSTRLQVVTPNQGPPMIRVTELAYFELRTLVIDGNRSFNPDYESATIISAGVRETRLFGLDVVNASPIRVVSTAELRAEILEFGDLTFDNGQGNASLFTKRFGIDHIVQTGRITVHDTSGGLTLDSDALFEGSVPELLTITSDIGSRELVLAFAAPHGRDIGDWVEVRGADQIIYNGRFQVLEATATTLTISQALSAVERAATGDFEAAVAWGPIETITLTDVEVFGLNSGVLEDGSPARGQVRGVVLSDGIGRAEVGDLSGVDLFANTPGTPNRSSTLLLSSGQADLPIRSVDVNLVSGVHVGDAVRVQVGRDDFGRINIEELFAGETRSAIHITPTGDYSAYAEGHGRIEVLRIGHLVLEAGTEAGIKIDESQGPVIGAIVGTLVIGQVTNAANAPLLVLAPGSVERIVGGSGADRFEGTSAGESLEGRGGYDVLVGAEGDDQLVGGGGKDSLRGGDGDDTILGKAGDDVILGGAGLDTLTGGTGADVLQFDDGDTSVTRELADVVTDFRPDDRIKLKLIDADELKAGDQKFVFVGEVAFSGRPRELHYIHDGGNTYVEGDTDGDGDADFVIRLDGLHTLAGIDFVL